eukprot:6556449-Pyramimonas_sp.AAC.1
MAARGCRVPYLCLRAPNKASRALASMTLVKAPATMAQVGIQLSSSALLECAASLIMEATIRRCGIACR